MRRLRGERGADQRSVVANDGRFWASQRPTRRADLKSEATAGLARECLGDVESAKQPLVTIADCPAELRMGHDVELASDHRVEHPLAYLIRSHRRSRRASREVLRRRLEVGQTFDN